MKQIFYFIAALALMTVCVLASFLVAPENITSKEPLYQAEANRLKVAAGLTPQERMEYVSRIAIGVAEAMAKSQVSWVPSVMIVDGKTQGGAASGMDAVGLKMYLDIADKIAKDASKK